MANINDDVQYGVTRLTALYNWSEEAARVYLHAKMLVVAKMRGVFGLPLTHRFKEAAESLEVLSACSEQYDAGLTAVKAAYSVLRNPRVESLNYSRVYAPEVAERTEICLEALIGNSARDTSGETDQYFLEQAKSNCSIGAYSSVMDHIRDINFADFSSVVANEVLLQMQRDLAAWKYQGDSGEFSRWRVDDDTTVVMCGIKEVSPS